MGKPEFGVVDKWIRIIEYVSKGNAVIVYDYKLDFSRNRVVVNIPRAEGYRVKSFRQIAEREPDFSFGIIVEFGFVIVVQDVRIAFVTVENRHDVVTDATRCVDSVFVFQKCEENWILIGDAT